VTGPRTLRDAQPLPRGPSRRFEPAGGPADIRIEWVQDDERFSALAGPWEHLVPFEATPFQSHAWFAAWWRTFAGRHRLSVCAAYDTSGLAGVLPLWRRRGTLAAMANDHTPLFGPLARSEAALAALVDAAQAAMPTRLVLRPLDETDPVVNILRAAPAHRALFAAEESSPIVDTTLSREEFVRLTKPRWQAPIERLRRKLGREFELFTSLVASPSALERELREGFDLEASGWKGRGGTAILSSPQTLAFYTDVARAFHQRGQLKLSALRVDGRLVAFDLSLLHRRRLYLLKTAYDEGFRRFAPGLVLRLSVIERCIDTGLEAHELLGVPAEWKRKFSTGERRHLCYRSYESGRVGRAGFAYRRRARPMLKRAYLLARRLRLPGWERLPGAAIAVQACGAL
jgi:CelD/BcsL family acetyltransferase involved in cellulose biosynthesis